MYAPEHVLPGPGNDIFATSAASCTADIESAQPISSFTCFYRSAAIKGG